MIVKVSRILLCTLTLCLLLESSARAQRAREMFERLNPKNAISGMKSTMNKVRHATLFDEMESRLPRWKPLFKRKAIQTSAQDSGSVRIPGLAPVTTQDMPKLPSEDLFGSSEDGFYEPTLNSIYDDKSKGKKTGGTIDCVPGKSCGGPDCDEFWAHRSSASVEFLYLTARGANLHYATVVDGLGANAVPLGPDGVADPEYDSGLRFVWTHAIDRDSSFVVGFSHFESSTSDSLGLQGGSGFVRADVVHPNTVNVAADSLNALATYDIDFQFIDAAYRHILYGGSDYAINYFFGFRYGTLDQDFQGNFTITGRTTVNSEVDFHGFGPRLGLEGERNLGKGMLIYSRGAANFLAGEFHGDYLQTNIAAGSQARLSYDDDRIVSLLELELGVGWENCCGNFRVTAGYYIGAWFNSLTTAGFINGVQNNNFTDVDETLSFDGLTARAEYRY